MFIEQKEEYCDNQFKLFGCNIEKNIPDFLRNFLDEIRLDHVIRIPNNSPNLPLGSMGNCHQNVYHLTKLRGGQILRGYMLEEVQGDHYHSFALFYHSVYVTPEGNAICITDLDKDPNEEYLFVPIGLGLFSLPPISKSPLESIIDKDWENSCYVFDLNTDYFETRKPENEYNLKKIKRLVKKNGGLFKKTPPDKRYFSEKVFLDRTCWVNPPSELLNQ